MFHQDLLNHLGMGAESEKKPEQVVCYRDGDETEGLDLEERSKILKLAYLFLWQVWLAGSQEMPVGARGLDHRMNREEGWRTRFA